MGVIFLVINFVEDVHSHLLLLLALMLCMKWSNEILMWTRLVHWHENKIHDLHLNVQKPWSLIPRPLELAKWFLVVPEADWNKNFENMLNNVEYFAEIYLFVFTVSQWSEMSKELVKSRSLKICTPRFFGLLVTNLRLI